MTRKPVPTFAWRLRRTSKKRKVSMKELTRRWKQPELDSNALNVSVRPLIALARRLNEAAAVKLLGETVKEEQATDEKLSLPAEEKVAAEALGRETV